MNRSARFAYWRDLGLSVRAANLLINRSCFSIEDVRKLGEAELQLCHGMGPPTYNEVAELVGWPLLPLPDRKRKNASQDADDDIVTAVLQKIEFQRQR